MRKVKPSSIPLKHIPQRTCIGCQKTGAKREFVRVVCLPSGAVEIDPTGKKSGRGAYLCLSRRCWENALKSGRLGHSLRTSLKTEDKEKLVNYARGIDNSLS